MQLIWTQNTDNDFKNYTIYKSPTNGTLGTAIQTIVQKQLTNFTVVDLLAKTTYYFTIRVFDTNGLYSDSNQDKGTTTINLSPNSVVLNDPTDITESSMRLSWTENTDNDFNNYTVFQSNTNGTMGTAIHTITQRQLMNYTVTGLTANTTYYFTVRVFNTGNLYSDSNQVKATTLTAQSPFPWIPLAAAVVAIAIIAVVAIIFLRAKRSKQTSGKLRHRQKGGYDVFKVKTFTASSITIDVIHIDSICL
jgi:muconolactone delta-isomerase